MSLVDSISTFMSYAHGTVNMMSEIYYQNEKRFNYTTPKTFLELIALYAMLLNEKHSEVNDRVSKLENGILKLKDCASQVSGLQEQLAEQEIVLTAKKAEADKQLAIVTTENDKVQGEKNFGGTRPSTKPNGFRLTIALSVRFQLLIRKSPFA